MSHFDTKTPGRPLVILPGLGCTYHEWYPVIESLKQTFRVISFHRHELMNTTQTGTVAVALQLQELLKTLDVTEPVLLVGHSYGGLCAQQMAHDYPETVRGLVLVDSTSVRLRQLDSLTLPVLDELSTDQVWLDKCRSYAEMTRHALCEAIRPELTHEQRQLPVSVQRELLDFQTDPLLYGEMATAIEQWQNDAVTLERRGRLADLPLIVLGRDKELAVNSGIEEGLPEAELRLLEDTWKRLICEQADLSTQSELLFVEQASHAIHLDRPNAVLDAVRRIDERAND
ncbi:alpha/beta hydrolase (plasmid) [Exiguobacterium sp. N4-1P]|uniref:alpha/beta hydrolase n=1 Tax=Exiguobacterium sp. N4-1P TaxID=2051906 RepID=UPI000B58A4F6|nr:alpha/beta hydrolase [Exiguobacterium sp. N4-1P]ASI35431.1 alpha/beta hydrolase [Exiguobacterium sp. N4-1P]ASI37444.1 alpha/beta hydrolase [Exiguobacterium sp. N4-1P]